MATPTHVRAPRTGAGLWIALLSAAGFGTSGAFGKSLIQAGWSPGATTTARIGGAALVLAVPTARALRGRWHVLAEHWRLIVAYGVVAMAGCQLAYFQAVTRLPVGVALLIEYLAPVLMIGWLWFRTQVRPSRLTLVGSVASMAGLVLVLDLTGSVRVDAVGVAWALGAAVCVVVYFVLSGRDVAGLPPLVLAGSGMVVAAVSLVLVGAVGVMPFEATSGTVDLVGRRVSWLVPLAGVVLASTVLGYTTGIVAARRLGARVASFVGLTEVMFAVLFAWFALGELPFAVQLAGGVLIVVGIGCIRFDEVAASDR